MLRMAGGGEEKAMEWISTWSIPRWRSTRQAQERVSHTRRRVPWVEAEVKRVPDVFMERAAGWFSWPVIREMFVGRLEWWVGEEEEDLRGVRSTSWMCPG
jgi:hypothetical protein